MCPAVKTCDVSGERTQWFFCASLIVACQCVHAVMKITALIWDQKKKRYLLRYCKLGSRPACCHGRSVFFSGNQSVKLLDLNQVVTVLNQNVTESRFTYSHLVTFQDTVISKGSVTTIIARVTVIYWVRSNYSVITQYFAT